MWIGPRPREETEKDELIQSLLDRCGHYLSPFSTCQQNSCGGHPSSSSPQPNLDELSCVVLQKILTTPPSVLTWWDYIYNCFACYLVYLSMDDFLFLVFANFWRPCQAWVLLNTENIETTSMTWYDGWQMAASETFRLSTFIRQTAQTIRNQEA